MNELQVNKEGAAPGVSEVQGAAPAASEVQGAAPGVSEQQSVAPGVSDAQAVLERLLLAHQTYFDVERDHEFAGRRFEGYAELHSSSSKYVLVKRAKLWEANSHEYMFFLLVEHLDMATLDDLVSFMTNEALAKVTLERNHMSTYLTLVIVAGSMDRGLERTVRKARFRKNFLLGLKGWVDLRLCVIDLASRHVVTNAMGKEIAPTLESNAFGCVG